MRMLHIVAAYPRGPGDVIVPWLVELLRRLRASGHDVEVLTSAYLGSPDQIVDGVAVHRFRYWPRRWENLTHEEAASDRARRSLLHRAMPLAFLVAGMVAGWRLGRRQRYDVVHVHWPVPLALLGWAVRWAGGGRLVLTFYGAELRLADGRWSPLRWLLRRAVRGADRVVAISTHTAGEVRRLTGSESAVIPYGVALPRSPAPAAAGGGMRSTFTILFVGRLVARKGVVHLIAAVATMREATARLVIIGDGPERSELEALAARLGIAAVVEFQGRVSDDALRRAFSAADVFVLPSVADARGDTEGLGVVLLEAMQYGVPVIGSRIGGITDIIEDGVSGVLVPPADAAALAAALRRLHEDPGLRRRLGEGGERRVRDRFGWEAITARWVELYQGVMLVRA